MNSVICDICNSVILLGENAGTHRVCPEALKVATLPLDYHWLATN
jgi:hypothetical protein